MGRSDGDALLLQVSADISRLQKQFDKAVNTVNSGSKTMEDRATKFAKTFGNANDNAIQKFSYGIGKVAGEGLTNFSKQAAFAGTALDGFGAAGVAAAAVLGGLVVVLGQAKAAVAFGDAIADSATKVGVSTDTLQEYRYAIHQLGGEYEDADAGLSEFTKNLGKAQLGFSKKSLKPFAALGFSKEDLNSYHSADEALKAVLDRLAGIQDESKRQALASALGLDKFIPLAREGSAKLDELREAAHRLGYVMDKDLIAKAGEANDKLEDLEAITNVQLKSAFVDLAPVILQVAGALADAAREVNKIASDIKDAMPVLQKWFGWLSDANKAALDFSPAAPLKQIGASGREALDALARAGRAKTLKTGVKDLLAGGKIDKPADFAEVYGAKKPSKFDPIDQSTTKTPRDTNAERTDAINGLLASAAKDLLQAQSSLTDDIQARAKFERDITAQQLAADLARLAKTKADLDDDKGISDATRTALKAKIDEAAVSARQAAEARDELTNREAIWAEEDRADATRTAIRDAEIDSLRLQADLASTQAERTRIERQILKLQQDELTHLGAKANDRLIETGAITPEEADRRATARGQGIDAARGQFDLDHEGPAKKYLRSIQDLDTEMQNAGVQAFDNLSGGLAEAIANAQSLGDVGSQVFKQLEIEMLRLLIKAGTKEAASYFGFSSGGYLGGYAEGGRLLSGPGTGTSDSILATNGKGKFARFSDGEFISTAKATRKHRALLEAINSGEIDRYATGGMIGNLPSLSSLGAMSHPGSAAPYFDLRGALVTEEVLSQMNKAIAASEQRSVLRGSRGGALLARDQAQRAAATKLGF